MVQRIAKIGICIAVVVLTAFTFGCAAMPDETWRSEPINTTNIRETTTPSPETEATGQTLSVSDTEGTLLTYLDHPAPVFAYSREYSELIAYCYEDGSSHLPYVLGRADQASSEYVVYIPDFDRTVNVLFDEEYEIWRVFTSPLGSNSGEATEWVVYSDREHIANRAADLQREVVSGAKPRYYSVESGLYYFFREGGLTVAIDMNGDGSTEMINVFSTDYGKNKTSDCSVRINGEEGFIIEDVRSFSGAYVTDVNDQDDWKEVVFEYCDSSGAAVSEIMRYDGNSIRTEVLRGDVDCAGDGKVYQRTSGSDPSGEETVAYEVDEYFVFREV
ncbi:MAG: hypothetical protein JW780_03210 [Clostridiales bacterium]|nr:hypothetical protein [Clostridiales bacterium]